MRARREDCEKCGKRLPPSKRRFCYTCVPKKTTRAVVPIKPEVTEPLSVFESTKATLEAAGRADQPLGVAALLLAARVDLATDTGSSLAALVKQLEATLKEVMRGVKIEHTAVDELRARRDAKLKA